MATSSDSGGKRPSVKSSGKGEKQSRRTRGDDSDKICGFHPLRSLRNIFFGYIRRETPPRDEAVDTTPKAKSTDDIVQQMHQQQEEEPTAVVHPPVTSTNSANPIRKLSRTSIPMVKQLSKSADNLVSSAEWIPAPHGIPSAVTSPFGSEASNLNSSTDEIEDGTALDSNSVDEFFVDKWSHVRISRTRAFSSGDAGEVDQEMTFDLDSVHQTKALDVSVAKDRIAIKPKGKRVTVAMQQKIFRAEALPQPTKIYHLQSLTEANEDEDEGKREQKEDASAAAVAGDKTPAMPDAPIRREKKHMQAPNMAGRMTINITPEMLAASRKKAIDCSNSNQSITTNHRPNNRPPPPTCPKKRKTIIEPERGTSVQDKKTEDSREEPAKNDATLGGSVTRRPLLSLKEDEVASEEDGDAVRPKAPPRVRPKTRPKTMMHAAAPQTTGTEPEWVARTKKKNALVE